MKILYFTGTGNSLYVAKQFAAERISITQAMKNNEAVFEDDEIGIICPIYCHMPPKIVQEFLDKVTLSANYIFVIFTYGNRKCDAFEWMDEFMKSKGIDCSYIDAVKMVDNFLPSFDMNEQMSIMITGPATKITNLGAVKIVLGIKNFCLYLLFVMLFSLIAGGIVNFIYVF